MLEACLRLVMRCLIWLRYRVTVVGLEGLVPKDRRGILFLPNHPALIDPMLMLMVLTSRFRVGVLADKAQIDRPIIRSIAKRFGAKAILDPAVERDAKGQIEQRLAEIVEDLNQGKSFLLYPAGRLKRQRLEDLGGNSAVETLLRACPEIRVVLARTRGLWGSSFGWAGGAAPNMNDALRRGLVGLLKSGIFFGPRRAVTIEFSEPNDLPRDADRAVINRYLERFYNQEPESNTYVPYSIWGSGRTRVVPEPQRHAGSLQAAAVPAATRKIVDEHLRQVTGLREISPEMRLAHDLGLDSLARVELQAFIEKEFGFQQQDGDALETVGDVLLAACGEGSTGGETQLKPVPASWFCAARDIRLSVSSATTIGAAFLDAAAKTPNRVVTADQTSGAKTYRDLITAILLMRREIRSLDGEYIGIMLPASVAATVAYLSVVFAGKTPVMVNWTTGPRGVEHCLDLLGIKHVLSARPLLQRLQSEGFSKAEGLLSRIVYLEDVARRFRVTTKLMAVLRARISWAVLRRSRCCDTAVVLFTSGSENLPKAVPLTHENVLTNVRDVMHEVELRSSDAMLGMLPPFHSFGLTVNLVLPMVTGLRVAFHPNPTEAAKLAAVIATYKTSIAVATPTFLNGIASAAKSGQLDSLRLVVTGAEQCPPRVYDLLAQRCPGTLVIEGYGITECSPIVAANRPGREQRETIGTPLPSVEAVIVDPERLEPVAAGERGLLLVRGKSVFEGYLRYDGELPFLQYAGKRWYRTGDLVRENEQGNLVFCGRMKRFIKLGGEMISLPAIESVLTRALGATSEEGPALAVEATTGEHPELVLFTTIALEREAVNRSLRDAGLSPLHNIREVRKLDQIPLLGTGKTDYRSLKAQLA